MNTIISLFERICSILCGKRGDVKYVEVMKSHLWSTEGNVCYVILEVPVRGRYTKCRTYQRAFAVTSETRNASEMCDALTSRINAELNEGKMIFTGIGCKSVDRRSLHTKLKLKSPIGNEGCCK